MEAFLKKIKFIEGRPKDLVNGFVHETQSLLPKDNDYFIIPSLIIYTILYYFYAPETFDVSACGQGLELNEDKTIAKMASVESSLSTMRSVYGTKAITCDEECIYEWKFKFANIIPLAGYVVGIHSFTNYHKILDGNFVDIYRHFEISGPCGGYTSSFWGVASDGWKYNKDIQLKCIFNV